MRILCIGFWCCIAALGLVACVNSDVESYEEGQITQERAEQIILAVDKYAQDHDQPPHQLDVLVPAYLKEIPKTAKGQSFDYRLCVVDGYDLCYHYRNRAICCYIPRLESWDCTPYIPPE